MAELHVTSLESGYAPGDWAGVEFGPAPWLRHRIFCSCGWKSEWWRSKARPAQIAAEAEIIELRHKVKAYEASLA